MKFYKYQANGNDFILIENVKGEVVLHQEKVKILCQRRIGIGADGLIILSDSTDFDFNFKIYNSDGQEASMCANGARIALYHCDFFWPRKKQCYSFKTKNGIYSGSVSKNLVSLKMVECFDEGKIDVSDLGELSCFYVNTGVPHTTIEVKNVDSVDVFSLGKKIRHDPRFLEGSNVNFFEILDEKLQKVKVRVYERGVEDETLSCGTGIYAISLHLQKYFGFKDTIYFETKGGNLNFNLGSKELEGEVELIFVGDTCE